MRRYLTGANSTYNFSIYKNNNTDGTKSRYSQLICEWRAQCEITCDNSNIVFFLWFQSSILLSDMCAACLSSSLNTFCMRVSPLLSCVADELLFINTAIINILIVSFGSESNSNCFISACTCRAQQNIWLSAPSFVRDNCSGKSVREFHGTYGNGVDGKSVAADNYVMRNN